jgi:hypothetical protein
MPAPGRRRLTPEDVQKRITEYCERYDVRPNETGLPPFPSGQRETQQHREWMAVYRAHSRLAASSAEGLDDLRSLLGLGGSGPKP